MTMKKFSLSLMVLAVGFSVGAQTFSGGDGSEATPYLIKTVADMKELSTVVLGGNNLAGKYVRLDNDITYGTGDVAAVVGDKTKKFNGTFDGNNHSISGFKLNGAANQAIFAYTTSDATIKNLKVTNATITSSDSYSGVIVGQNEGTVENSVIGRGCVIKEGAVVKNCVVNADVVIGKGVHAENLVIDKHARLIRGKRVIAAPEKPGYIKRGDRL